MSLTDDIDVCHLFSKQILKQFLRMPHQNSFPNISMKQDKSWLQLDQNIQVIYDTERQMVSYQCSRWKVKMFQSSLRKLDHCRVQQHTAEGIRLNSSANENVLYSLRMAFCFMTSKWINGIFIIGRATKREFSEW